MKLNHGNQPKIDEDNKTHLVFDDVPRKKKKKIVFIYSYQFIKIHIEDELVYFSFSC